MALARSYDSATVNRSLLSHLPSLLRFPALVWANRYLVQNFLRRDLLSRAHGSLLGVLWILLQPLFMFATYFFVFGILLGNTKVGQPPDATYAIYLFSGVLVFHAITEATSQMCVAIADNGNLVKKVAFPSEVLLVHYALVSLVIYLVGAFVLVLGAWILEVVTPGWSLLRLPLVLAVQFVLCLGLGMMLACCHVFVRDTAHIWRIWTTAWVFLSPVFLRTEDLSAKLSSDVMFWMEVLNPAWSLIQAHRLALGGVDPSLGEFWSQLGVASCWAVGFLLFGYGLFMSRKHKFADVI